MFPNVLHHNNMAKVKIFKVLQSFPRIAILSTVRTKYYFNKFQYFGITKL